MNTKYYVPLMVAAALFARPTSAAFCWDDADEDAYDDWTFTPVYQNGGEGFDAWTALNTGYPSTSGGTYLVPYPPHTEPYLGEPERSWGMNGNKAMGRGFEAALSAGTWTFLAAHHVDLNAVPGFSGFNLKSVYSPANGAFDEGELIRFGFNHDFSSSGLCVSVNGGEKYDYFEDWDYAPGDTLQYSITWHGNGTYTLSVDNLDQKWSRLAQGNMGSGQVAMLGAAIYGGSLSESLVFDAYEVIPEPAGAVPVLALSAFAMALRRNRQRRS